MSITDTEALTRVIEHREIFHDEMLALMRRIMSGEMSPVMIAALSIGLRVKKETIGEIAAAAQVMREFATRGRGARQDAPASTSWAPAATARTPSTSRPPRCSSPPPPARAWPSTAGAACRSTSGSADVLEALGALHRPEARAGRALPGRDRHRLHVRAQPPRVDEARRAGAQGAGRAHDLQHPRARSPTRPARPTSCMGVFHPDLVGIQVRVLQRLGSEHVMVVYGMNGMDEISLSGETMVGELKNGEVREYVVHPSDFGLPVYDSRALKVANTRRVGAMHPARAGQRGRAGARHRAAQRRRGAVLRGRGGLGGRGRARSARGRGLGRGGGQARAVRQGRRSASDRRHERRTAPEVATDAATSCSASSPSSARRSRRRSRRATSRPCARPRASGATCGVSNRRLRRRVGAGSAGGDRRDQEGEPEQGRAARALRAGRDRRQLRARTARPA